MRKKKNKRKYLDQEYLPEKLVIKFTEVFFNDSTYDFRRRNNFLLCIALIFHHQINSENISDYVPLGCAYWKKIFGGNYYVNVIEPLLKQSIIEYHDFGYRTFPNAENFVEGTKGLVGIRYRINLSLLDDQFQIIQYINKVSQSATGCIIFGNEEPIATGIPNLNFRISIDHDRANEWVNKNAKDICDKFFYKDYCQLLPDDLLIEYRESIDGSYNIKYKTVKTARFYAQKNNLELFHFKDKFYIADSHEFIKQHISAIIYHYKHQIARICTLPIEEIRSSTNLRVHSNLTNFPSKILPFIYINNRTVVQLDLRTSQFLLFANLINVYIDKGEEHLLSLFQHQKTITYLKRLTKILNDYRPKLPTVAVDINNSNPTKYKYSDVTQFIKDVFFHDFYIVVKEELSLPNRLIAKQLLFKLLFKKSNKPDVLINKLKKCYEILMEIIASFKEKDIKKETVIKGKKPENNIKEKDIKKGTDKKGKKPDDSRESNFSVFLQCIESEIFIDNILKTLRLEGVPCFTRHDSIVVAVGYENRAEEIAKNVFEKFGFRYNHKAEELFWDIVEEDELEEGDFMQSVIDKNILNEYSEYDFQEEPNENEEEDEDEEMDQDYDEYIFEQIQDIIDDPDSEFKLPNQIRDDYYEFINSETIGYLASLDGIEQEIIDSLEYDFSHMNLDNSDQHFQNKTNEFITYLIENKDEYLFEDDETDDENTNDPDPEFE